MPPGGLVEGREEFFYMVVGRKNFSSVENFSKATVGFGFSDAINAQAFSRVHLYFNLILFYFLILF